MFVYTPQQQTARYGKNWQLSCWRITLGHGCVLCTQWHRQLLLILKTTSHGSYASVISKKVTNYFNYHPNTAQLHVEKQPNEGISQHCVQYLKHDTQTRCHSKLFAMENYFSRVRTIAAVAKDIKIPTNARPHLKSQKFNTLSELDLTMKESLCVACELEAHRA